MCIYWVSAMDTTMICCKHISKHWYNFLKRKWHWASLAAPYSFPKVTTLTQFPCGTEVGNTHCYICNFRSDIVHRWGPKPVSKPSWRSGNYNMSVGLRNVEYPPDHGVWLNWKRMPSCWGNRCDWQGGLSHQIRDPVFGHRQRPAPEFSKRRTDFHKALLPVISMSLERHTLT